MNIYASTDSRSIRSKALHMNRSRAPGIPCDYKSAIV